MQTPTDLRATLFLPRVCVPVSQAAETAEGDGALTAGIDLGEERRSPHQVPVE